MRTLITTACIGLSLISANAFAQWGSPWGNPYGQSSMMPQMPGGGGYSHPRYNPQPQPFNMPFAPRPAPAYNPPPAQPFGGGMMPQMPYGGGYSQPQPRYQQPAQQPYMMPGMDQGIRSMMQPGKIMAEEATPGMYMKPTWR